MRRLLIFCIIVAVVGLVAFAIVQNLKFHLVKTDPANGSKRVATTQIVTFYFNQNLENTQNSAADNDSGSDTNLITVTPSSPGQVRVEGKKVTFTPGTKGFNTQTYTVHLANIESAKHKKIPDVTITFTVAKVAFNELTPAQQQQQINQTDQYHDANTPRNSFIQSLPYTTPGYSVEYIQDGDYFLVRITDQPVANNKADALRYISAHGVDTTKERVDFFVLRGLE